jgi:hypothetical protein
MKYELGKFYKNENFNKNSRRPSGLLAYDQIGVNNNYQPQSAKTVDWKDVEEFMFVQGHYDFLAYEKAQEEKKMFDEFKSTYYERAFKNLHKLSRLSYSPINTVDGAYEIENNKYNGSTTLPLSIENLDAYGVQSLNSSLETMESDIELLEMQREEEKKAEEARRMASLKRG